MAWPKRDVGTFDHHRSADFIARGTRAGSTMRLTSVLFDDETFEEIRALARKRHVSFCATVRDLTEIGIEQLKLARVI